MVATDVVRSEPIQISSRLKIKTAAKMHHQVTNAYGGNVFREFCNVRVLQTSSVMTDLKMSPVLMPLPAAKQRIFNDNIQSLPVVCITS